MSQIQGRLDGEGRRFALVVSRFNDLVTERLTAGARACLLQHGTVDDNIDVIHVPGAWELPLAAQRAAKHGGYDAVIALGCVIRGETPHFDYVAGEAASGLMTAAIETEKPIVFGVLTTDDTDQALARAGGKSGNKGWEAALSALEMVDLFQQIGPNDGERT